MHNRRIMVTQELMDNLKSRLTQEELQEIRQDFGLEDPRYASKWTRMWKVSPKQGRVDMGLVRAAKEKIKKRVRIEHQNVSALINEVEQILESKSAAA